MVKPNNMVTFVLVVHRGGQHQQLMINVANSVRFPEFIPMIKDRCGSSMPEKCNLFWIEPHGDTIALNGQPSLNLFVATMWCMLPFVIHVLPEGASSSVLQSESLIETANILFKRYDVNGNGRIERYELLRLLKDLHLERLDIPPKLVQRFVEGEFARLDHDDSHGLSLSEFAAYVSSMTRWMKTELLIDSHQQNVFAALASSAVEAYFPPVVVPPAFDDQTGRGAISRIDTKRFGIRIEIPEGALESIWDRAEPKLSVSTLCPTSIAYLSEGITGYRGEFIFSPVVRVDYPAFEKGMEAPELASGAFAYRFRKPLTLIMPHFFDAEQGKESAVMLGAPHGATQWEQILLVDDSSQVEEDAFTLSKGELRVKIPYAGTFCAFSSTTVDDIAAVRFHLFATPELARDAPAPLRVVLCPDIPDQVEEMLLTQTAEWGITTRLFTSPILHLCQGARFRLTYLDQLVEIIWHGVSARARFTIPTTGDEGQVSEPGDPDNREVLKAAVAVEVIEGEGRRAANVRSVARRAGIPQSGYLLPFSIRMKNEVRPNRPILKLKCRSPFGFTVVWRTPKSLDGDGNGDFAQITHYSIELATCAPNGTSYPWRELWAGAGCKSPDFSRNVAMRQAQRTGDKATLEKLKAEAESDNKEAPIDAGNPAQPTATENDDAYPDWLAVDDGKSEVNRKTEADPEPLFNSYTLIVDASLFGKLRIRCWADGEVRPSKYSEEVALPRFMGKDSGGLDAFSRLVLTDMKKYFSELQQHTTDGKPVEYRIGNAAGQNAWGGDSLPPPPPPTEKEKANGLIMAPVPYDVPHLRTTITGLTEAGTALAALYREMGVIGGGGGSLCGLTIDHLLHAVVGTPTVDGMSSPSRTKATLDQPLMALCEVMYADVLLPLFDTVVVLKKEWQHVNERVSGIVAQVSEHRKHYDDAIVAHVKQIIRVLIQTYEMLRQCQDQQTIAFHLSHLDYTKAVKKELTEELRTKVVEVTWKLSTALLNMQLELRRRSSQDVADWLPSVSSVVVGKKFRKQTKENEVGIRSMRVREANQRAAVKAVADDWLRSAEEAVAERAASARALAIRWRMTTRAHATKEQGPPQTARPTAPATSVATRQIVSSPSAAERVAVKRAAAERSAAEQRAAARAAAEHEAAQKEATERAVAKKAAVDKEEASRTAAAKEEMLRQSMYSASARRTAAAERRASARRAAIDRAESKKLAVQEELRRLHTQQNFHRPPPGLKRAGELVARLEARLIGPVSLANKASRPRRMLNLDKFMNSVQYRTVPPSLAVPVVTEMEQRAASRQSRVGVVPMTRVPQCGLSSTDCQDTQLESVSPIPMASMPPEAELSLCGAVEERRNALTEDWSERKMLQRHLTLKREAFDRSEWERAFRSNQKRDEAMSALGAAEAMWVQSHAHRYRAAPVLQQQSRKAPVLLQRSARVAPSSTKRSWSHSTPSSPSNAHQGRTAATQGSTLLKS